MIDASAEKQAEMRARIDDFCSIITLVSEIRASTKEV
jgi:hypothetical protein